MAMMNRPSPTARPDGTRRDDADADISRLIDAIFAQALKKRASDIHFEPGKGDMKVRFRVDGLLREVTTIPETFKAQVVSSIKVTANLDIAEKRVPQDGRKTVIVPVDNELQEADLRVSTLPTLFGEKVVIRLLPQTHEHARLGELGFDREALNIYRSFLRRPQGLILFTGPTGSGKTSTLYSSLLEINDPTLNVVTIEDPIEYQIPDISQVQVHPKAGLTFASGLRSILRQDPDVIMVGEVRDLETAGIVFQSALTGHLVFSTLHTNDTVSAVNRLVDMGVEYYLIASATIGIVAQRLVRRICPHCQETYQPDPGILIEIGLDPQRVTTLSRGSGCQACFQSGYLGREALFEVLPMSPAIKSLVHDRATEPVIRSQAEKEGLKTLAQHGRQKVLQGVTTPEELLRVILV